MKQIISSVIAVAVLVAFAPVVFAHEVTYRGAMVGLETGAMHSRAGACEKCGN